MNIKEEIKRTAKAIFAIEFDTKKQMDEYFREHPKADKNLHHVKRMNNKKIQEYSQSISSPDFVRIRNESGYDNKRILKNLQMVGLYDISDIISIIKHFKKALESGSNFLGDEKTQEAKMILKSAENTLRKEIAFKQKHK